MGQHGNSGSLHISNLGNIEIIGFVCCCSGISLREKKSKLRKKKRQLKTERINTAKTSREQVPTDLPALGLEGVALQLGPIAAGNTRGPTWAGKGAFYSPLPADPAARARAQSRVMSPGLLMLPRQAPCCTPTSAFPASCRRASELHFFRRWTLFDGF